MACGQKFKSRKHTSKHKCPNSKVVSSVEARLEEEVQALLTYRPSTLDKPMASPLPPCTPCPFTHPRHARSNWSLSRLDTSWDSVPLLAAGQAKCLYITRGAFILWTCRADCSPMQASSWSSVAALLIWGAFRMIWLWLLYTTVCYDKVFQAHSTSCCTCNSRPQCFSFVNPMCIWAVLISQPPPNVFHLFIHILTILSPPFAASFLLFKGQTLVHSGAVRDPSCLHALFMALCNGLTYAFLSNHVCIFLPDLSLSPYLFQFHKHPLLDLSYALWSLLTTFFDANSCHHTDTNRYSIKWSRLPGMARINSLSEEQQHIIFPLPPPSLITPKA